MSGRLVSAVFDSALPGWLKPYAAAIASFARDDGARVFPSLATLARMVGRDRRSARRAVRELRALGLLKVITPAGHHRATTYQFRVTYLPAGDDGAQLPLVMEFPQGFQQLESPKTKARRDFRKTSTGMGDTSARHGGHP